MMLSAGVTIPLVLPIAEAKAVRSFPDILANGVRTVLRREADGSVTIISLAMPWRAALTRENDGTAILSNR